MNKDQQPNINIHNENHNCNIFQGPTYGGIFPLPGANVTIHQYASDAQGKPTQEIQGPSEKKDDRDARKQAAIKDICQRLDNLEEDMLGHDNHGQRISHDLLGIFFKRFLGVAERGSKHEFVAIQEAIWTILIDNRFRCTKTDKETFFSQTFLNIMGYLHKQGIINGKVQDILECLYQKPETSMRKCLERGIVSAFPEGTEDMLDFYITHLKQTTLI